MTILYSIYAYANSIYAYANSIYAYANSIYAYANSIYAYANSIYTNSIYAKYYVIIATGNGLAIGGALALCILAGGHISGGNFNPVVSVMMAFARKLPINDLLPYVLSQMAGGITALLSHNTLNYK